MKKEILSREDIFKMGISFDNLEFSSDGYDDCAYIIFYDKNGNETPFTGIAYDFYRDSNVIVVYMFVKDGVRNGQYVEFYPNSKVKRILEMRDNVTFGECFEFYETGEVMRIEKRIAGFLMTFRQYDKDGNIIKEKNELSDFDKRILAKFEIK